LVFVDVPVVVRKMDVRKVLYITYDGLTDPLGQSQVLPYLLELSKHGYQFTILSFEKNERFAKEAPIIHSIINNAAIEWVPLSFTSSPPILSKIYDRYRMLKKALSLYRRNNFDIIHCRSYVAAEIGFQLKKRFGVKFLFDMRGFWADEKVDNGQWDLRKPHFKRIYRHYKNREKAFLLNADGIISLTEAGKTYLLSKPEYKNLSISVIPCCADLEHFNFCRIDKLSSEGLRSRLGIPDYAKVITYLGSVGGWYMTKEMFTFFKLLLDDDPSYFMLVLTKDNSNVVKNEAQSFGMPENKLLVTYSNRNDLPLYLSLSFFSIFFIRNTFSKIASSPTKHAELMGMGIPVICNDIGDTGYIMQTTKTGIILNEFSESAMKSIIESIEELSNISPYHIRREAKRIFDLHIGADQYLKVYHSL
jgi:glycosyltransferase involved in cell wall biosynthesis